jgi:hypothetical protein
MATAFWRYGVLSGVLALPPTIRLSAQFAKLQYIEEHMRRREWERGRLLIHCND